MNPVTHLEASSRIERPAEAEDREVQIADEEFPELAVLVDEAFAEIKSGNTRPWPFANCPSTC